MRFVALLCFAGFTLTFISFFGMSTYRAEVSITFRDEVKNISLAETLLPLLFQIHALGWVKGSQMRGGVYAFTRGNITMADLIFAVHSKVASNTPFYTNISHRVFVMEMKGFILYFCR